MNNPRLGYTLPCALLAAIILAACSTGGDGKKKSEVKYDDYQRARSGERLEIPPDLTQIAHDDRYQLPADARKGPVSISQLQKKTAREKARVLLQPDNIKLRRQHGERWLEIKQSPEKLWPQIRKFWRDNGLVIKVDKPEIGIMETDWAEKNPALKNQGVIRDALSAALGTNYASGLRDMYRTRLEPGASPGTSDIFISHRGMEEIYLSNSDDTRWQQRPPDRGLEVEMLRRLMVYLGADEEKADSLVAASAQQQKTKLALLDEKAVHLRLSERFDRAWRRIGRALDRGGFTVEDRNRSKGLYYVRYVDPDAVDNSGGFWSALAFWRDKPKNKEAQPQRLIEVKRLDATSSQVRALFSEDEPDLSPTGVKILQLLRKQMQ